MEELSLLQNLDEVKAPPDFEQRVLTLLSTRRERKRQKVRAFRFSFAGACAAALVFIVILNVFVVQKKSPSGYAELEKSTSSAFTGEQASPISSPITIIETLDYSSEMRRLSNEPKIIYILESVSGEYRDKIKY